MGGQRGKAVRWSWLAGVALLLSGCHDAAEPPNGLGGESHFLMRCASDDSCAKGLACLGGLCTQTCTRSQGACTDLHPQAECRAQPNTTTSLCDLPCGSDDHCSGTAAHCNAGLCRPHLETTPEQVCSDDGCPEGGAGVPLCPASGVTEDQGVTIEDMRIDGDTLHLSVRHAGGCERNEFVLCQAPEWGVLPVTAPVTLVHTVPGEALCQGIEISELTFDLSEVGQRYRDDLDETSGVIRVSFGFWERYAFYAIGEPTCLDRQATATQTLSSATTALPGRCDTSADCLAVSDETLCSSGCGALISAEDMDTWQGVIAIVDAQVCGLDAREQGCVPVGQPCPGPAGEPACIDGNCRYSEP